MTDGARAKRIAALNDHHRANLFTSGRTVITSGVQAKGELFVAAAFLKVTTFNTFNGDNDPYRERDFGGFEQDGETLFWKIDYYDPTGATGSEDPADPEKTLRVLTLMLAEEY
jgi:hypothetical protein